MNEDDLRPLISHLLELRSRLLKIVMGVIILFLALFQWSSDLYQLLALPLLKSLPNGGRMIATDVTTPFFVPMKVTLMAAFLLSLPYTLYQIWAFVAPGLFSHEKKLVCPLVIASFLLFLTGMTFAYFLVFPVVFHFMISVVPAGVVVMPDIDKYLSFVLGMFVAFGLTFEVPIAVILLTRFGIISIQQLKSARPYIIVGAFVVAAVITPPDIVSQIMLAIPLWLLFELGVIIASWLIKPLQEK